MLRLQTNGIFVCAGLGNGGGATRVGKAQQCLVRHLDLSVAWARGSSEPLCPGSHLCPQPGAVQVLLPQTHASSGWEPSPGQPQRLTSKLQHQSHQPCPSSELSGRAASCCSFSLRSSLQFPFKLRFQCSFSLSPCVSRVSKWPWTLELCLMGPRYLSLVNDLSLHVTRHLMR